MLVGSIGMGRYMCMHPKNFIEQESLPCTKEATESAS